MRQERLGFMEETYHFLTREHKLVLRDTGWALTHLVVAIRDQKSFEEELKPIMAEANKAGSRNLNHFYAKYPILELYMLSFNIRDAAYQEKGWTDNDIAKDLEDLLLKERLAALDASAQPKKTYSQYVFSYEEYSFSGMPAFQ